MVAARGPPLPPVHTPCVHFASGLGFAQPGPDPTARSTRLANAAVPKDNSPAASEAPARTTKAACGRPAQSERRAGCLRWSPGREPSPRQRSWRATDIDAPGRGGARAGARQKLGRGEADARPAELRPGWRGNRGLPLAVRASPRLCPCPSSLVGGPCTCRGSELSTPHPAPALKLRGPPGFVKAAWLALLRALGVPALSCYFPRADARRARRCPAAGLCRGRQA